MALIKCTKCGQMISDKSVACPHCGAQRNDDEMTVIQSGQQDTPISQQNGSTRKLWIIPALLAAIVIGAAAVAAYFILHKSSANQALQQDEVQIKKLPSKSVVAEIKLDDEGIPLCPDPPRLVNDFSGLLGSAHWLEDSLENIANVTSNQICIVTMDDFGDYDKALMARSIGQKWGVGANGKDNGVVILVKPKTADANGEAFIAIGRGLENNISDQACTEIVNREMIPHFKEYDYPGGVWAGAQIIRDLAIGKYDVEYYLNTNK